MGPDLGPPFDLLFNACIDKMKERVHAKWEEVCGDYTAAERAAPEYQMGVAAAGCIRVVCDPLSTNSRVIDSHNGIMAARSCRELLELEEALTGVAAQVNEQGGCANSSYSVRLLTPEEFSSGRYIGDDSCDQLTCDVEGESVIFTHVP